MTKRTNESLAVQATDVLNASTDGRDTIVENTSIDTKKPDDVKNPSDVKGPIDVKGIVRRATELNDFTHLLDHVPYAKFIGMAVERFGDELVFKLPAKDDNIGNPVLPAIHGGVIAGFMEMSAIVQLMVFMHTEKVPKVIDFSIDYLRAGYHKDTFAECRITRQGRRVANVNINCWQTNRKQLIATARAHFLID